MKTQVSFTFNYRKATQALNQFALKQGGRINKMKALKLVYFADRYHLRKYGRLITNDTYVAMDNGAVPSSTRDILEKTGFIGTQEKDYANCYISTKGRYDLESNAPPDNNVFSQSDIEAIEFAWKQFGHLDKYAIAQLTHKYPEWLAHEETLKQKPQSSIPMDIDDFFDDPSGNVDKCFELSSTDKSLRLEHLKEMAYIESIWS
jgi:uncharacterized phage-associated protein